MTFLLILFMVIFLAEIGILVFKIYQFIKKVDKLYDYFIRPEDSINSLKEQSTQLPPLNGECPTKEELDNFGN
jgi:hypothetical protein